jgi:putative oxidoreductase
MRNTKTTSDILPAPVATRRRALTITLWVLQVLVAFQFAAGGYLKLSGAPEMVDMFATIGAGQWFRVMVGALEIAGAIGLLIPRIAGLAALGLVALMVGATITNLFILKR